jgi:hypothetical protein
MSRLRGRNATRPSGWHHFSWSTTRSADMKTSVLQFSHQVARATNAIPEQKPCGTHPRQYPATLDRCGPTARVPGALRSGVRPRPGDVRPLHVYLASAEVVAYLRSVEEADPVIDEHVMPALGGPSSRVGEG